MRRPTSFFLAVVVTILALASFATAFPHDDGMDMNGSKGAGGDSGMDMTHGHSDPSPTSEPDAIPVDDWPMSYFSYGQHSGTIIAHIAFMIVAWCFVLPTGMLKMMILFKLKV